MQNEFITGRIERLTQGSSESVRKKVLIVEDSRAIVNAVTTYLKNIIGVEPVVAMNLAEAEEHLANAADEFFCSILDLNLPDAPDGEIVDAVHKYELPIIVLTGMIDESVRKVMREKMVLEYVVKRDMEEIEHVAYLVGRLYENQQIKVMVVENTIPFQKYIKGLLENYRYQVLLAENGHHGLELLAEHPDVSLIITDSDMPEMNGVTMIREIRKKYRREDLAIIGLSNATSSDVTVNLLKAGANDFIAKSFEMEEFYCRVTQNTNMVSYMRHVRDAATQDFLTKIYNRRYLFELGEQLYANARRDLITIAVALIDADYFKKINDNHGHAMGDLALVEIASTLKNSLRKSDVVARFGGEEFVCVAIIKKEEDALPLFEKLRSNVEAIELYTDTGERVPITVSIGITTLLSESFDDMLKLADSAVYDAKDAGRNRVAVA